MTTHGDVLHTFPATHLGLSKSFPLLDTKSANALTSLNNLYQSTVQLILKANMLAIYTTASNLQSTSAFIPKHTLASLPSRL
jgi:hypothetical protein